MDVVIKGLPKVSGKHPDRNDTLLNPFEAKLLGGGKIEPKIRSLFTAIRDANRQVRMDRPSLVLFSNSSGFPLYRIYFSLIEGKESGLPDPLLLPFSSHNFHPQDKAKIIESLKEIRRNTFEAETRGIVKALELSRNPDAKIYLIDEVLSGSSVVGAKRTLEMNLKKLGAGNKVHVLAIASQEHMIFQESLPKIVYPLVEQGEAFVHPDLAERKSEGLKYSDFQLTGKALTALFNDGKVRFKNGAFEELVRHGEATVIPVIRLFTTDNPVYNPLLVLNEKEMKLESRPISYTFEVNSTTSHLLEKISVVSHCYSTKKYALYPADHFKPQELPDRLRK